MSTRALFEREAVPQLGALHSFAYRLCGDRQYSMDLVQETMLKAFGSFHLFRPGTNCKAWLFQICKNSFINEYRRKQLGPIPVSFREDSKETQFSSDDRAPRAALSGLSVDSAAFHHASMVSDEVARALSTLPPDYQTAVLLCDVEGYSYEEIAEFTNVPVGTVRSRIHRGRKMLESHLTVYARRFGLTKAIGSQQN